MMSDAFDRQKYRFIRLNPKFTRYIKDRCQQLIVQPAAYFLTKILKYFYVSFSVFCTRYCCLLPIIGDFIG